MYDEQSHIMISKEKKNIEKIAQNTKNCICFDNPVFGLFWVSLNLLK